jgi:phosphoesterase RecJ-like protein
LKLSDNLSIKKVKELLSQEQQKIVIVSHRNPDGDAVGSSLALYNYFIQMGHEVKVIVPNAFAGYLRWLPGASDVLVYEYMPEKCARILKNSTLLFAVDFNDLSRVREFEEHLSPSDSYKVLIDHHPHPGDFADFTISDTSVSSTCELIYIFLKNLEKDSFISSEVAECIYAGIITDTGCFNFNSSKRQTFDVVADLLDIGIDKDKIYDKIYDNYSFDRMKLMGHVLQEKMVYLPEFRTAYLSLSSDEMKQFNFKVGDSEGFVNIPLSIKGVIFSALFTEREDIVKVSLRSKGNFAVNKMAQKYFSGGGHVNASGGESKESLEDTIKTFVSLLPEFKEALDNEE